MDRSLLFSWRSFPTKIRYTSMSLPYHIGNGVFGGLVPFIGLLLTTTYPKDPLVGLWYPIGDRGPVPGHRNDLLG